ncbi:facilitated trehalose transporter Tret1-like [Venturia canescens]|uniref:facilitated trehalose transporter Tret1-like n=1 Tax=Venturia canescens TaxID=32260 RepID=UPI001C9C2265|nr:facilitated trehalose transporter Tret1-like [Venturia canescens]
MGEEKSTKSEPGRLRQTIAAVLVNVASLAYGTMIGWPSPITPQLQSVDTPVGNSPMTDEETSWLTGALCVGALVSMPFCSIIAEKLGRRKTGFVMTVPFCMCWLLIIFATDYSYLYIGRFFAGVGGAICFFLVPLYVSEISADSIRGQLGSFLVFGINIGIVTGYVTGAAMSYHMSAVFGLVMPLLFLVGFVFVPETPVYLIRHDRPDDAARSLLWLKNGDKAAVDRELLRIQLLVSEHVNEQDKSIGFKDLFRDRGTIKGFVIACGLMGGQQLCGITAMISYAATIFKMAGSSMSPDTAAIIIGSIQVFGSWLSSVLMERAGRRPLLMVSCGGMAMCHCAIAIFCTMLNEGYDVDYFRWLPVASLSIYALVYNVGMGSGPFIVASEIFNADVRGLAISVAQFFMWALAFLLVKFFPAMMSTMGVSGCFFFLALCCLANFIFVFILVPETKGRTLESIIDELNGFTGRFDEKNYVKASLEMSQKNINLPT